MASVDAAGAYAFAPLGRLRRAEEIVCEGISSRPEAGDDVDQGGSGRVPIVNNTNSPPLDHLDIEQQGVSGSEAVVYHVIGRRGEEVPSVVRAEAISSAFHMQRRAAVEEIDGRPRKALTRSRRRTWAGVKRRRTQTGASSSLVVGGGNVIESRKFWRVGYRGGVVMVVIFCVWVGVVFGLLTIAWRLCGEQFPSVLVKHVFRSLRGAIEQAKAKQVKTRHPRIALNLNKQLFRPKATACRGEAVGFGPEAVEPVIVIRNEGGARIVVSSFDTKALHGAIVGIVASVEETVKAFVVRGAVFHDKTTGQ